MVSEKRRLPKVRGKRVFKNLPGCRWEFSLILLKIQPDCQVLEYQNMVITISLSVECMCCPLIPPPLPGHSQSDTRWQWLGHRLRKNLQLPAHRCKCLAKTIGDVKWTVWGKRCYLRPHWHVCRRFLQSSVSLRTHPFPCYLKETIWYIKMFYLRLIKPLIKLPCMLVRFILKKPSALLWDVLPFSLRCTTAFVLIHSHSFSFGVESFSGDELPRKILTAPRILREIKKSYVDQDARCTW